MASDMLLDIFGFELLATEKLQKSGTTSSLVHVVDGSSVKQGSKNALAKLAQATASGRFVLRNCFSAESTDGLIAPLKETEEDRHGLLLATLCILHLSGGELTEEALFNHLTTLDLKENLGHDVFGDKWETILLKEFVSQRWLHAHKNSSGVKAVSMGERALAVVSEKDIYLYIADVFGATPDPLKMQELEQQETEKQTLRQEMIALDSEKTAKASARAAAQANAAEARQQRAPRAASERAKAKVRASRRNDDDDDDDDDDDGVLENDSPPPTQRRSSQRAAAKRSKTLLSESEEDDDSEPLPPPPRTKRAR